MSDQHPLSCSAQGNNRHVIGCTANGVSMLYAACLHRLSKIDDPTAKVPKDWAECGRHQVHNQCRAATMRAEERAAGYAMFYLPRESVEKAGGRIWSMPQDRPFLQEKGQIKPTTGYAPKKSAPTDIALAIGQVGTLADAVTAAAAVQPAPAPAAPPVVTQPPREVANKSAAPALASAVLVGKGPLPGESPLQMARRLMAERAANQTPT